MFLEVQLPIEEIIDNTIWLPTMSGVKSGGIDPVVDATQVENETNDIINVSQFNNQSEKDQGRVNCWDDASITETSLLDDEKERPCYITPSGHNVIPTWKMKERTMSATAVRFMQMRLDHKLVLTQIDRELAFLGATGMGFEHTSELQVMTFEQVMKQSDAREWQEEIDKEYEWMTTQYKVWTPIHCD